MKPNQRIAVCRGCGEVFDPKDRHVPNCPKCHGQFAVVITELTAEQRIKLARIAYVLQ